jgi:hypothetical protein
VISVVLKYYKPSELDANVRAQIEYFECERGNVLFWKCIVAAQDHCVFSEALGVQTGNLPKLSPNTN